VDKRLDNDLPRLTPGIGFGSTRRRSWKLAFRALTLMCLGLLAAPHVAEAQAGKVPRLGVLMFTETSEIFQEAFRQGLREHGHVEGQTILVEWRSAGGRSDRANSLAAEFVRSNVDVIVAVLSPAVQAAKNATDTIPIVMAPAGDPVGQGFVASLARPGGNITGLTGLGAELSGKRLQLLKDLLPRFHRVAVLLNGTDGFAKVFLHEHETAAKMAELQLQVEVVRRPEELEAAFAAMANERPAAVIVQPSLLVPAARASQIARLALQHGLPSVSQSGEFAGSGGLMSYGASFRDLHRRAAVYVDKILKGAKPRDLPVEQATKFDLVINLKTARALGITIPPLLRLQADTLIE
jgi:putative ABC transport system substrate-binding protein